MDKTSKNHYILVVHGTWNAPEPGKLKWYQLRTRDFEHSSERLKDTKDFKNFCEHLNEHFAETPMRSAVWKSANDIQSQFSWSGDNDHTKRIEAAEELAADILRISRADPLACIHLIGHSHGGNVILKAVDNYVATFQRDAKQLAEHFFEVYKKPEDLEKKANLVIDKVFAGQADSVRSTLLPILEHLGRSKPNTSRLLDRLDNSNTVHVKIKLADAIAERWIATNALGSAVFLGTPFYRKVWKPRHNLLSFLLRIPGSVMGGVFSLGLFYVAAMLVSVVPAGFEWLIKIDGMWPDWLKDKIGEVSLLWSWNPLGWPTWLLIIASIWLVLSIVLALSMLLEPEEGDTNFYFDELQHWQKPAKFERIPALVIRADRLDEARIALSALPLVSSYLEPQLRSLLTLNIDWTLSPEPPGQAEKSGVRVPRPLKQLWHVLKQIGRRFAVPPVPVGKYQFSRRLFQRPLEWLTHCSLEIIFMAVRLPGPLVVSFVKKILERAVDGVALGIPVQELRRARVVPSSTLGIPLWFDEENHDVSEELVRQPMLTTANKIVDPAELYGFLTDQTKLDQKKQTSKVWKKVHKTLPEFLRRYPDKSPNELEHDLLITSLTIEERFRQVTGAIELGHSMYYTNPDVILRIANFVLTKAKCIEMRNSSLSVGEVETQA